MTDKDLFYTEIAALTRAQEVLAAPDRDAAHYQQALRDLVQHYRRLMRETRRLIQHGDRTEAELNDANTRLQELSAKLDYKARHDSLTGTLNRGAIFKQARQYLESGPLSLITLDIDFFKHINDTFGHPAGDTVLIVLVERLSSTLAGRGNIGRIGGEEFTVLLPRVPLAECAMIAEALRKNIADHPFPGLPSQPITASFGISWSPAGTRFESAYARTDAALYRAKRRGRNQVSA